MTAFLDSLLRFAALSAPYWGLFLGALVLSLVLTPICRNAARRLGMVDAPSVRRINKVAIPRAGGLAVFLATVVPMIVANICFGMEMSHRNVLFLMVMFSGALCLVGLIDDKFGMHPLLKLLAQILIAAGTHFVCDIGFSGIFPSIPPVLDAFITVFWITGAVNAFNLIDGLDGLASGLAVIGSVGMAGALFFTRRPELTLCHFAFTGACLGFLRYNFNPASVFLGDTGSMFLGFFLSTSPLLFDTSESLFVSIGVPVLAMGVPIFDTALAILRRTLRSFLFRGNSGESGNRHVMQPDTDHLHHRILRSLVSQRKAAFALYAFASFLVLIALGGIVLEGRAVALFIVGFMVVATIIFRDMRRIELWDAGRLLSLVAHDNTEPSRHRRRMLTVPFYVISDITVLFVAWLISEICMGLPYGEEAIRRDMALRTIPVFLALVFFRTYVTSWSRAMLSNYVRLGMAVVLGSLVTGALVVAAEIPHKHFVPFTCLYSTLSFTGLLAVRMIRPTVRDLFYAIDSIRLQSMPDVGRVLVYGAGLRYRSFRRELVRGASANRRIIVGIMDDDPLLHGKYIGGIKVHGGLEQAPRIIKELNVDSVVIACAMAPERMETARGILDSCGVNVTLWVHEERAV